MFWEELPLDIRVYILSLRHEKRESACKKIQKMWNNYNDKIDAVLQIALELEIDADGNVLIFWPRNIKILRYCYQKLNSKYYKSFWSEIINAVKDGLNIDKDSRLAGGNFSYCYNEITNIINKIQNKVSDEIPIID